MFQGTVIMFSFTCIVLVVGIPNTFRKFDVEKDVEADNSIQPLEVFKTLSLIECAAHCSRIVKCCSAGYGEDFSCNLYDYCSPATTSPIGGKHLRKRNFAGLSPKDCAEIHLGSDNGVYTIYPTNTCQVDVYCEMGSDNGLGWTVIQRRIDGTVDFNATWADYKAGFGDKCKEYWIGNDILNIMSTSKPYILRFDMAAYDGSTAYAEYDVFHVADEALSYTITIGNYSGTAGDEMTNINGMEFTTLDRDNDDSAKHNCAHIRNGGWWFRACCRGNPNGMYGPPGFSDNLAMYWRSFKGLSSLASISMKIRP